MAVNRREVLLAALVLSVGGVAALLGCGSGAPACADPELLSTSEKALREQLGYGEVAPEGESQHCGSCVFFRAGDEAACGRCEILNGPVSSGGLCSSWSAKA